MPFFCLRTYRDLFLRSRDIKLKAFAFFLFLFISLVKGAPVTFLLCCWQMVGYWFVADILIHNRVWQ